MKEFENRLLEKTERIACALEEQVAHMARIEALQAEMAKIYRENHEMAFAESRAVEVLKSIRQVLR